VYFYPFFFCFSQDFKGHPGFIVLANGIAYFSTPRFNKGIGHSPSDNQVVYLIEDVLDDGYFGRNLGPAQDGSDRLFTGPHDFFNSFDFPGQEVAETFFPLEIFCDDSG